MQHRPAEGRRAGVIRSRRKVQPLAPHRRRARRVSRISGSSCAVRGIGTAGHVSNRRGRAGHTQRRVGGGATRTRPLQSATRDHRSRTPERSRPVERSRPSAHRSDRGARRLGSDAATSSDTGTASSRLVEGVKDSDPKRQKDASTQNKVVTRMERRRAIRRRRARIIWVVCGAFCLLVLLTSFPAQALLQQRSAINASQSELDRLTAGNKELQSEATELSNPANIAALA